MRVRLLSLLSLLACAACGGGSGTVVVTQVTAEELEGYWTVTEIQQSNCGDDERVIRQVTILAEGNRLTVAGDGEEWTGTVAQGEITFDAYTHPDGSGTTTVEPFTLTAISQDALSGQLAWAWSDGAGACSGTSSISVVRNGPTLRLLSVTFPGDGTDVPLNATIEFQFNVPVDPSRLGIDIGGLHGASGTFLVAGSVVRFVAALPQRADLFDLGLRPNTLYSVAVEAGETVSVEGIPLLRGFQTTFTTIDASFLPVPGDLGNAANRDGLPFLFVDEDIRNEVDACPRENLPPADRSCPQVTGMDPEDGATGAGAITAEDPTLGVFIRLDPFTFAFSEPIAPWSLDVARVTCESVDRPGQTYDTFVFFRTDRTDTLLQVTVFDADSPLAQDSVPAGTYRVTVAGLTDFQGNLLLDPASCVANGAASITVTTVDPK